MVVYPRPAVQQTTCLLAQFGFGAAGIPSFHPSRQRRNRGQCSSCRSADSCVNLNKSYLSIYHNLFFLCEKHVHSEKGTESTFPFRPSIGLFGVPLQSHAPEKNKCPDFATNVCRFLNQICENKIENCRKFRNSRILKGSVEWRSH